MLMLPRLTRFFQECLWTQYLDIDTKLFCFPKPFLSNGYEHAQI